MTTRPVVSAAKFTAYRKADKLYCDILRKDGAITDRVQAASKSALRLSKPIYDAIKSAEGKARNRIMHATGLIIQVRELEERLGVHKKSMDGMRVRIISWDGFLHARKSWKYPSMATAVYLTNRMGAWQIDEIRRIDTRGIDRATTVLHLPDAARDKIVKDKLSSL